MRAHVRVAALCSMTSLLAAALTSAGYAFAEPVEDVGSVRVTVHSAATHGALGGVRVFLSGPIMANARTTSEGVVRYIDVRPGTYRVKIGKAGFTTLVSSAFEATAGKEVEIDVELSPDGSIAIGKLRVIGSTKSRVRFSSTQVDDNSAVGRISRSLTDALATLPGIDISQPDDPSAPQAISLRGQDEAQVGVTLDGVPLSAPGTAANLRAIDTDLFAGAAVDFRGRAGAMGGSVNFRTLVPTPYWQAAFGGSLGSFDRYAYRIAETGSIGKLGIAALHAKRAGNNPLTFRSYEDQSGITYPHGGETATVGDLLKLTYAPTPTMSGTISALQSQQSATSLCLQFVTPLPCGAGPGNSIFGRFRLGYGTWRVALGDAQLSLTAFASGDRFTIDDSHRTLRAADGTVSAQPYAATNATSVRGAALHVVSQAGRHALEVQLSTSAARSAFLPLTPGSGFSAASTYDSSSRSWRVTDEIAVNDRVAVSPTASFASTSAVGSAFLAGLGAAWRPSSNDSFTATAALGSSQPGSAVARAFSDPQSARVNCLSGTAVVAGPGDQPTRQSAVSYDVNWLHAWSRGQLSVSAYRNVQAGQLLTGLIPSAAASNIPGAPYVDAVDAYFATVCPGSAAPAVYVQQLLGGTARSYQGYLAAARIAVTPAVLLIPSISLTSAVVTSAPERYTAPGSTVVPGAQIVGRPLHGANLTAVVSHPPSSTELVLNARYVGDNNAQHIRPYTTIDVGLSRPVAQGRVTVFATNLTNAESGEFATLRYAEPIPLSGGGALALAGTPNTPRQYTIAYSFQSRTSPFAAAPPGIFAFGDVRFPPPPDNVDPLTVAADRPECTAELRPVAERVLSALRRATAAYGTGGTLPEVEGFNLIPFGDFRGPWLIGLAPKLPPLPPRAPVASPPDAANAGDAPRPQITPSPEALRALVPARAVGSCAYVTVLTPAQAEERARRDGIDMTRVQTGPGIMFYYARVPGLLVVRAPDVGVGGGSVRH